MSPATSTAPISSPAASTGSLPRRPPSAMAPDLPIGASAPGPPEPQTLPFFLPPPPPPLPLPAEHRMLPSLPVPPPPGPIVFRLHPAFLAEMDYRRSHSLVLFLKDDGAVPSPEEDKTRKQVIHKLKKIVMDWAKVVVHEQRVPPRRATATALTYGSYTLGAHGPESDIDALCDGPCIATLQKFQVLLRCIKLWARRQGLHCHEACIIGELIACHQMGVSCPYRCLVLHQNSVGPPSRKSERSLCVVML